MTNTYAPSNLWWPTAETHQDFDWSDAWDEDAQESRYEYWEAIVADGEPTVVYGSNSGAAISFTTQGEPREHQPHQGGYEGEIPEGPLSSGYWPLGGTLPWGMEPEDAAWRMRNLSVCLVQVDDTFGVALCGGGMDLSWVLAAGAIAAGYLPWSGLRLDSWEYGVGTVGTVWARRIRAARRYRLKAQRRRDVAELNRIAEQWH